MRLGDRRDKERQMFEGGVYLQLGFSVHAYLLTEKDVHNIPQMKKHSWLQGSVLAAI